MDEARNQRSDQAMEAVMMTIKSESPRRSFVIRMVAK
jgi:hypothetical protein